MTVFSAADPKTRMIIAIEGVEKTEQVLFSLIDELTMQGFTADAAALQAILDTLVALIPTIKADVVP